MRRPTKAKVSPAPATLPLRKVAALPAAAVVAALTLPTAAPASPRAFPAWIDASEGAVTFTAAAVTPRVRDSLVLRAVAGLKKPARAKSSHGPGAR